MKNDLLHLTLRDASTKLAAHDISAVELTQAHLTQIEARDPAIHAYLEVFTGSALAEAKAADERIASGDANVLTGIPLAVKDSILIEGKRASAASKMLEEYVASYDATAISKLKSEGAVFLGRTNMDEFALGGSTENSAFGPTKNPYDEGRVAGGTSGGSAAAVAADMAMASLGSDTGGSVRNPASYCGAVGLKPTYGSVSRSGLIAAVSSFDQIGPITKTVADAEILFNVIRGKDPLDSTSRDFEPIVTSGKKIGVPAHLFRGEKGLAPAVLKRFEESEEKLKKLGYEIVDITLPSAELALPAYYIINFAEVSSNLARFDGVRYGLYKEGKDGIDDYAASRGAGFGRETRRRIILGTHVLSAGYYDAYYGRAVAMRHKIAAEFQAAFAEVDLVMTPTMPTPAFKLGEKSDPVSLYLEDLFTVPANLTGMPALSVPMGLVDEGGKKLPAGLQFMAPSGAEDLLFAAGKEFLGEVQ